MFRDSVSIGPIAPLCNARHEKHVKECGGLLDTMYQHIPETGFNTMTRRGKGRVLNVTRSWKGEGLNARSLAENILYRSFINP